MTRATIFSPDRIYRYVLWRDWQSTPLFQAQYMNFVCLNPSTADETKGDPTLWRCMNYARAWGYGALCITNLFAFRATNPRVMKAAPDPVGPENDKYLVWAAKNAALVVAAWGNHGAYRGRDEEVRKLLPPMECLKMTKAGQPSHPLFLRGDLRPTPLPEAK